MNEKVLKKYRKSKQRKNLRNSAIYGNASYSNLDL